MVRGNFTPTVDKEPTNFASRRTLVRIRAQFVQSVLFFVRSKRGCRKMTAFCDNLFLLFIVLSAEAACPKEHFQRQE